MKDNAFSHVRHIIFKVQPEYDMFFLQLFYFLSYTDYKTFIKVLNQLMNENIICHLFLQARIYFKILWK